VREQNGGRAREWGLQCLAKSPLNTGEKGCSQGFRDFFGDVATNISKVYFCRLGKAKAERSANSFRPRGIMCSASNCELALGYIRQTTVNIGLELGELTQAELTLHLPIPQSLANDFAGRSIMPAFNGTLY
jgi:hypothetical protein